MPTINMRSSATLIKGQGVGSCFEEQIQLVSEGLSNRFNIHINRRIRSDIVHYHTVNLGYYLERQLTRHTSAGVGYVHFLPDTLDNSLSLPAFMTRIFSRYLLRFYNSMDYLVTVNPAVVEKLRQYGVNRPKIFYIPNFVSDREFYPRDKRQAAVLREKYNLSEDAFVVVGVGQLQTRKGIADFVETARRLPHVQFVWAGGFSFGKITDGYEQIRRLVKNAPSNVHFLGIVERNIMPDIYNMADMLFLPSFDELFPMAVLEAVSCGLPLLLRDIEIYRPVFFDSYLKGCSVEDFAFHIESLYEDSETKEKWRNKSLECGKRYTRARILQMWEAVYTEAYTQKGHERLHLTEGRI